MAQQQAGRWRIWCVVPLVVVPLITHAEQSLKSTDQLTPDQLTQAMLADNASLREIVAAAEAASIRVEHAGALPDPMLTYMAAPQTFTADDLDPGQRIEVMQTIPWPGKLDARSDAARAEARASSAMTDTLKLELISSAKAAFAEWYFVHEALEVNQANRKLLEELEEVADSRYVTGRGSQQDVLRAKAEQATLAERALALKQQIRAIQARLNALMNRSPNVPIPPPAEPPLPGSIPPERALLRIAIESHPELAQIDSQLDAAQANLRVREIERYPDFQVMAGYNSLWMRDEQRPYVGVTINVPLNQGRRSAAISEARANVDRARWALVDRRNELLSDVAQARSQADQTAEALALYRERLLPLAQETLRAARNDYEVGDGNFLNVIEAEERKLATEQSYVRTLADHYRAVAQLERALGQSLDTVSKSLAAPAPENVSEVSHE